MEKEKSQLLSKLISTSGEGVYIKKGGIYLITGGAGGLGKIFASYIAQTSGTQLILAGRSEKCELDKEELGKLHATYYSCDVTDKISVNKLITTIKESYGQLNGIIHGAGLIKDSFILNKKPEVSAMVLAPKIQGARNLDEATKDLALDFTIYFSSLAGIIGNIGQADYASANAWLDNYAYYRNELKAQGKRNGISLSVNWPLWKDGGMQVDEESGKLLAKKSGMQALPTKEGILAFETILGTSITQGIVIYGKSNWLETRVSNDPIQTKELKESVFSLTTQADLKEIQEELITILCRVIKLKKEDIEVDVNFSEYGVDSIMMMNIMSHIEKHYQLDLALTALFDYSTVEELSEYLTEQGATVTTRLKPIKAEIIYNAQRSIIGRKGINRSKLSETTEIAIIGYDGSFYKSDTPNDLWLNVKEQSQGICNPDVDTCLKLNAPVHSASSIKGLGIRTSRYQKMSYQQKLVFDTISNAIEKSGLSKEAINHSLTGVFVAADQIREASKSETKAENYAVNMLPAKISFELNLKGPSEIHNASCVSTYLVVHKAILSINFGECEQAIVVGVNIITEAMQSYGGMEDLMNLVSKQGTTL